MEISVPQVCILERQAPGAIIEITFFGRQYDEIFRARRLAILGLLYIPHYEQSIPAKLV